MSTQNSFQAWLELCTVGNDDNSNIGQSSRGGGDDVAIRLRNEAHSHFEKLSSAQSSGDATTSRLNAQGSPSAVSTVSQDVMTASSGTPNGALAILLTCLGPAFKRTENFDTKTRALYCLIGALEGTTDLTHGVRQAVGRFLVEICRPGCAENEYEDDDIDDINLECDYVDADNLTPDQLTRQLKDMASARRSKKSVNSLTDDNVRDAAVTALKALLRSQLEIFPTQQSQTSESTNSHSPASKALGVIHQSMELRLELAMLGLRYRCQVDESEGSGHGFEPGEPGFHIEDGLSHLPRLKRTLCFNLLEDALDGLKGDESKSKKLLSQYSKSSQSQSSSPVDASEIMIPSSLLRSMVVFASLTSSCIHGETDPRCILQLLRLLNKMQQILIPFFNYTATTSKSTEIKIDMDTELTYVVFPSIEIFDAVAPYYPVQFTPPKNDPHGITRNVLQDSLLAVLCERGTIYSNEFGSHEDAGVEQEGNESMITLAGRLFLERLEPPNTSDYDPPSESEPDIADKLDAVQDLTSLLLPPSPSIYDALTRVSTDFLSELSLTLVRVHEQAVVSDATSLASALRKFSSRLANNLEPLAGRSSSKDSLWEAYVVSVLRHLAPTLGSAPQGIHGRSSTAYFAAMAAEGGLMTLNKVLEFCFPQFIGVLSVFDEKGRSVSKAHDSRDEEKLAAAMRGIAALTSSCRVALQKWQRENNGVQVHPHPLLPYTKATMHKISMILAELIDEDDIDPLSLAAVGALESLLTSSELNVLEVLDEEDLAPLEQSIKSMSCLVFAGEAQSNTKSKILHEWYLACARLLGAVISAGLCQTTPSDGFQNTGNERISELATVLLPETLASATSPSKGGSPTSHPMRYDWAVLAGACANGSPKLSDQIVSELISRIISSLQSNQTDLRTSMMALSYITIHGGSNVGIAFHGLSPPSPTPNDLLQELCQPLRAPSDDCMLPSRHLQVGMSMLQLPVSRAREEKIIDDTTKRARWVLPFLLPAYESTSSIASFSSLVQFVNQVLPPLSEWDEMKLFVVLPLLAAVLRNHSLDWRTLDSATSSTLMSMVQDLTQFIASSDHVAHSRSAAASCLFSILVNISEDNENDSNDDREHSIRSLLVKAVSPMLEKAIRCLNTENASRVSLHRAFCQIKDTIDLMGVLGLAAACKGGSDSQTGDKIAFFFMKLACTGEAHFPFTETIIRLEVTSAEGQKHPLLDPASLLRMIPASAFGSMLSVHNGGPFWRQRMTHITLPVLLEALRAQVKSQDPPAMGTLTVVCHLICCVPATLLGTSNFKQIIPTLIAGLVYFSKNLNAFTQSDEITPIPSRLLPVVLAALLKILTTAPEEVTKFVGIIVPSLLILCSQTEELSTAYIPTHLIVLQCLETVATHPNARNSVLREKEQVVSVLSAVIDSPSALIRNAVVQARNVWYIL